MSSSKNLEFKKTSFLSKSNSAFIEQMYLKFINKDHLLDLDKQLASLIKPSDISIDAVANLLRNLEKLNERTGS